MIDAQATPAIVAPAPQRTATMPDRIDLLQATPQGCGGRDGAADPTPAPDVALDAIVICGRRGEPYRARALPPPPPGDGLLSRPLRVTIAPGVSFGLQPGGGLGLRAAFGPGRKDGEPPAAAADD